MLLFFFLIVIEVLTIKVLKESISKRSRIVFYFAVIFDIILSLWLWMLFFQVYTYKGLYDTAEHIRMIMSIEGTIGAVVFPRFLLILIHYSGKLFRIRRGGHIVWLTNAGLLISSTILVICILSSLYGRFNFKTEKLEVPVSGLPKDLDGLRIVQVSDMHLSSFYSHRKALQKAMEIVNSLKPDLLINTGDFISFGWREFDSTDTILKKANSRYGNYAVLGNHDFGTYHPFFTDADREDNVLLVKDKIRASGYTVLSDTGVTMTIGTARIGIMGISTRGKFTNLTHGDLPKAMASLGPVDFKILLSHDPNHWITDVSGKTDIDLTLSGHTHGMQIGIYTRKFRWSPAIKFYPHWNGLYKEGKQFHYVNRGLGTLGMPFRIWMPPEITLLILKRV